MLKITITNLYLPFGVNLKNNWTVVASDARLFKDIQGYSIVQVYIVLHVWWHIFMTNYTCKEIYIYCGHMIFTNYDLLYY